MSAGGFVIRHAAVGEADHVRRGHRLVLVDDDAGAMDELHAERQGHAQDFLRLVLRLDQHGSHHRHTGFDAGILAGEADLLGVGLLALETELGPGRIDQLHRLVAALALRRGLLSLRGRRGAGCAAAGGAAGFLAAGGFGLATGAGAGAGCWATCDRRGAERQHGGERRGPGDGSERSANRLSRRRRVRISHKILSSSVLPPANRP